MTSIYIMQKYLYLKKKVHISLNNQFLKGAVRDRFAATQGEDLGSQNSWGGENLGFFWKIYTPDETLTHSLIVKCNHSSVGVFDKKH